MSNTQMSLLICNFCKSKFPTKTKLTYHQKNAMYCKKIQISISPEVGVSKPELKIYEENTRNIEEQLQSRDKYIKQLEEKLLSLQEKKIEESKPLIDIGDGKSLIRCDDRGYIDVTILCKAGNKKLGSWKKLKKSQIILGYLSQDLSIATDCLTYYKNRTTYAHPRVAINIAQWISPEFDVKVSKWIYEIMLTGSFNIQTEKTTEELERLATQNRIYSEKIDSLEKKLLEKRKRITYPPNTVYLISTQERYKKGEFKIGKAKDLKTRIGSLNTSEEHIVYFYLSCKTIKEMNILEKIIHNHLDSQRITANREWFRGSVNFFTEAIESCARKNGYM